ncbi:MAG: HAD-IIIA family hydrolase, partial [Acidimicrobiia bacterium]
MILLDRDGVLNLDRVDSVKALEEIEIETGAAAGSARLARAGFTLAVITNQSAVGRGWMSRAALDAVNAEIGQRLGGTLTHWYICDHAPTAGCRCRKPDTLLLEQAHRDLDFDPDDTWFVGDAGRNVEAARR